MHDQPEPFASACGHDRRRFLQGAAGVAAGLGMTAPLTATASGHAGGRRGPVRRIDVHAHYVRAGFPFPRQIEALSNLVDVGRLVGGRERHAILRGTAEGLFPRLGHA